jgi:glycosyltransferase involved in cell wall biosynthesis
MPSAYNASQVVLNFSFSEGLSNALLEAIASGRPVLATNIAGNRYPVLGTDGDQPAGILFDPKDPNDFTRSAVRLVDDVDFRRSFEQAIRTRNLSRPTPETEAAGLMAVYESAILYRQR